ncbi:YaaR family protein [Hathewaya massiliensis]|uniref:YaaR family protein n=1 Tax=Hathewaya massiliensis TaxID=1964382 RepID=UPI001156FACC|nr:YaaR family protein [Hathewaya massiliensis]
MEIGRITGSREIRTETKKVTEKKDFSNSMNFAKQKKSEEELKKLFESIKKKGNRLAITKCYADVKAYKNLIREYLESVLEYMYSVKKDISFWQAGYFITVETIDQKLEELTEGLLKEEKESLNIAATIDEITGLLVDIYR